jgi:outer membrane protein assembly factor BamE (lipoprotein component of BamABCDE complex)
MRISHLAHIGRFFAAAALLSTLAACSTFEQRAKEKGAVFHALDAATQTRLEARQIEVGDTQDMVYISLGAPDEKKEHLTAGSRTTTWVYSAYWQEYQGTRLVGYRRQVVYDPGSKSYRVYHEPDYQPVYAPRVEDRVRITFQDGRVTVIEQAQPSAKPTADSAASKTLP